MTFYVYLISSRDKKRTISYVGYTKDIKERIRLHNSSKGAKFTKGRIWKLKYFKSYNSKKEAMREEYKLKKNNKLRNFLKKD